MAFSEAKGSPHSRRDFSVLIGGLLIFSAFVKPRWMTVARGALQAGQKAPDFNLSDNRRRVRNFSRLAA
jgi:hypothetical protein